MTKERLKRHAFPIVFVLSCALLVGLAIHADGGIAVQRNQDSFQSALGGDFGLFNFNSITQDQSFATQAINFGPFSIVQDPKAANDLNLIDVSSSASNINTTPFANMFLDKDTSVLIQFSSPVTAFGADFFGSSAFNVSVFLYNPTFNPNQLSTGGSFTTATFAGPSDGTTTSFLGFVTDGNTPALGLQLQYAGPSGGNTNPQMDNVRIASVPEPTSLALLGMGISIAGVYVSRRTRKRRNAAEPNRDGA